MDDVGGDYAELLRTLALEFLTNAPRRRQWREFYRVFRNVPPLPIGNGEWIVTGWDDVRAAMAHDAAELTALYPATRVPEINELLLGMLPQESGARHRRLRALVRGHFTEATAARLAGATTAALEELLYPAVFDPAGCDVLATLGTQVPQVLSCLLLDVAPDERDAVGAWSRELYRQIGAYGQSGEELRSAEAAYREFRAWVLGRAEQPPGPVYGGVGEGLLAAWRSGALGEQELLSAFALFLLTGLDTLTHAVGNTLCFLGSSPAVFAALRNSPGSAEAAFREALRLWGPIRLCVRHMQRPLRLATTAIPQGSLVFILIHAANRDPRRLPDPDEFRWDRAGGESLAFGVGAHGCLGGALGSMVGTALFRSLATRCAALRATPDIAEATFGPSLPILGIEDVRLYAEPAA